MYSEEPECENEDAHSFDCEVEYVLQYPWKRTGRIITFDVTPSKIQKFGAAFKCGTRVKIRCGQWTGMTATIVGIHNFFLWRHDDDERGAGAFNAFTAEDLQANYDPEVIGEVPMPGIHAVQAKNETVGIKAVDHHPSLLYFISPKEPFRYYAALVPASANAGRQFDPQRLVEYETSPQAMSRFGFKARQLVVYRGGPRIGRSAVIVGVLQGRLVRQEEGEFPRAFDSTEPLSEAQLAVIANDVPFPAYPHDVLRVGDAEFQTNDSFMMKNWGIIHGMRILHEVGRMAGQIGLIVGIVGEALVEYVESLGKCVRHDSPKAVVVPQSAKIIGVRSGVVEYAAPPPLYPFPSSISDEHGNHRVELRSYDIRFSACAPFLGNHGQAVKVTVGPRFGAVGRIVGVRENHLYCVFNLEQGAVPLLEEEHCVILARPAELLFHMDLPAKDTTVYWPAIHGERIGFDTSFAACFPFKFYPMQGLSFKSRTNQGKHDSQGHDVLHHGTVLGVWLHELWVIDEELQLALPLRGSNYAAIAAEYDISVCGLCDTLRSSHHDPYLDADARIFLHRDEVALQELSSVVRCRVLLPPMREPQSMCLDVRPQSFEAMGSAPRGTRLRAVQRMTPKASRVLEAGERQDVWQLFAPPLWATIVGVAERRVFVVQDDAPDVAVPIEQLGRHVEIVQPSDRQFIPPPQFEWETCGKWRRFAPPVKHGNEILADISEGLLKPYPDFSITLMDVKTVDALAREVSDRRLLEMKLSFSLLPSSAHVGILLWVLGLYGLHLNDYEHVNEGFRRLCVVVDVFMQPFRPPLLKQWFIRERDLMIESEGVVRKSIQLEEKEVVSAICFKQSTELYRLTSIESLLSEAPIPLEAASPTIRELDSPSPDIACVRSPWHGRSVRPVTLLAAEVFRNDGDATKLPNALAAAIRSGTEHGTMKNVVATNIVAPGVFEMLLSPAPFWPMKYVLSSGKVVHFDISQQACRPFGLYHGQQYEVGSGDLRGTKVTILGVLNKRIWRHSEGREAQPFQDLNGRDIIARHQLTYANSVSNVRRADKIIFHSFHGEMMDLDVSDDALAPYNVHFGDRYVVEGKSPAVPSGTLIVILGVRDEHIWFAQDWSGARPYDGIGFKANLKLRFLYTGDVLTLLRTNERRIQHGDLVARKCLVHFASKLCFDVTKEACDPFGVYPGQVVQHISGPLATQQAVILGVHLGRMYRQTAGDRLAMKFDCDADKFRTLHGGRRIKVVSWVHPPCVDVPLDTCFALSERRKAFCYNSLVGVPYLFDIREGPCKTAFGFTHGNKVVFRKKGKYFGKTAIIIGMRLGLLWKVDEGDVVATMFHGCHSWRDLESEYNPQLLCETCVKECIG